MSHPEPSAQHLRATAINALSTVIWRLDRDGLTTLAARALAAFLLSPNGTATNPQIGALIDSSSGAASVAIRYLRRIGLVERVPTVGYQRGGVATHRLCIDTWDVLLARHVDDLQAMQAAISDVQDHSTEAGQMLEQFADHTRDALQALTALRSTWHNPATND